MKIIYFDICAIPLFLMILFILEHTMRMMQSIGKLLVAETAESVALLEAMHCDYIQGYYFSRPLPGEDFLRFVEEANRPRPS